MNKQNSLKRNIVMNVFLTVSSFIFPLITLPYVTRILGPSGTGKVSFATSFISYFSMIAQLGIPTYGVRVCAQVRDDKIKLTRTAHELLFINLIMSAFSYASLFFILEAVPSLHQDKILYVLISSTVFLTSIGMEWLYKALEQYTYITIRSLVFKIVALAAMFLLVHNETDYVQYGFVTILASSASNIFNLINARKYIGFKPIGGYNLKRHLKPVFTFFAMTCATTIYTNLDTVMIGFMKSDTEVGYYNIAVKIKTVLALTVSSMGAVLLPRASYYISKKMYDEFYKTSQKAISFVFLLSLPLMAYFILYSKESILFLAGEQYMSSILPMQIIMPTLLFLGLTNIMGIQMLVPLGKENVVLHSEIAGAIVDIIINAILIPNYGAVGAAVGTLFAEAVVLLYQSYSLRDYLKTSIKSINLKIYLLGIIIATISALLFKPFTMNNFLKLIISAVMFFSAYGFTLLIFKDSLTLEIVNILHSKFHLSARRR